ncbi:MAG: hypothetical protein PHY99_05090 [Bacteroidales bacterium]|nr:hypothetical protein [Bacteroidales bacterium]
MKTNEVKTLLVKYYDGLTSPDEESDLEKYLLSEQVDEEFEADRIHFLAVAAMRDEDIPVPDDLERAVLNTLEKVQKSRFRTNRRFYIVSMSVAAALLLMVSTYLSFMKQDQTKTINDPQLAYAESRQALEMVSRYFNEGTSQLTELNKIDQAIEPLGQLKTLDKTIKTLSKMGKSQNVK